MPTIQHLIGLAKQHEQAGRYDESQECLTQAQEIAPDNPEVRVRLGNVQIDLEKFEEAALSFERAIELNKDMHSAYSGLARAMIDLGKFEKAKEAIIKSIELKPTAARYTIFGFVQSSLGEKKHAETSYRRALKLDPRCEETMFNLAAIRDFSKKVGIFPQVDVMALPISLVGGERWSHGTW